MAKRFTDTDKWKRPWYRKLPPSFRELWNYMLDSCDHAGIWIEDLELAEMILGFQIDRKEYEEYLGPKLKRIDEDKVFIPSFVEFQYGTLNPDSRAHLSVIHQLERYGIDTLSIGYPRSIDTLKDKNKDKDKNKIKNEEGGLGGETEKPPPTKPLRLNFEPIYQDYPRHDGKQKGLTICRSTIKTQEQYEKLGYAVRRYRDEVLKEGTEKKYIKQFSTFMEGGKWKDYLDPDVGTAVEVSPIGHIDWSKFTHDAQRLPKPDETTN